MTNNYRNLPIELREKGHFCCWRYEDRDGKPTKVPYNPQTGYRARSNDVGTFSSYETALSAVDDFDGLGVGVFDGLSAIDIDDCITDAGVISDLATDIIATMSSYTETSPSGHGIRILFDADGYIQSPEFYTHNRALGLEVYTCGNTQKFLTVTGNTLSNGTGIEKRRLQLEAIMSKYMKRPNAKTDKHSRETTQPIEQDDLDIIAKAGSNADGADFQRLFNGDTSAECGDKSEADYRLCRKIAFYTKNTEQIDRIFRQSGLMRDKWDRPQSGSTYGAITIQRALDNTTTAYNPTEYKRATERNKSPHRACGTTDYIFDELGLYTVPDLTDAERQPPDFIVDEMIPVGMTFLIGAPKTRKSFLAMQLAVAVANGEPFLGLNTMQCDVCYFDLEGSKSRVSTRTEKMFSAMPRNLLITNRAKVKLGDQTLIESLDRLLKAKPTIRLVIVDTYGRARGTTPNNGANAYDSDCTLLEPVQQFAIDHKIALLFVHHERKGGASVADIFERASGSMGITGSADSLISLQADGKRFDGRAFLEYTPRDAKGGEMRLSFNDSTCLWGIEDKHTGCEGNPIVGFCINNAPDFAKSDGDFFSYSTAYKGAYKAFASDVAKAGDIVRKTLMENRIELYERFNIGLQIGVKSHGERGFRIFKSV